MLGGRGVKGALLFACSPMDLSELLKEGTKESHDRAENTQFVKDFLKGRIKKELFKVSVALHPISDVPSHWCRAPQPWGCYGGR